MGGFALAPRPVGADRMRRVRLPPSCAVQTSRLPTATGRIKSGLGCCKSKKPRNIILAMYSAVFRIKPPMHELDDGVCHDRAEYMFSGLAQMAQVLMGKN